MMKALNKLNIRNVKKKGLILLSLTNIAALLRLSMFWPKVFPQTQTDVSLIWIKAHELLVF